MEGFIEEHTGWFYLLVVLVSLASLIVLLVVTNLFLNFLGKSDMWATTIETGGFKITVKGESIHQILDNLIGAHTNNAGKVVEGSKPQVSFLEKRFGIFWVSWLYPNIRLHHFPVATDKMLSPQEVAGQKLSQRVTKESKIVDYLRWAIPHPIFNPTVELGNDIWQVDMIIMLDCQIEDPGLVAFKWKGTKEVFFYVDAAVKSAVVDYCNDPKMTYRGFMQEDKGRGSKLDLVIRGINREYKDEDGNVDPQLPGIIERFGLRIVSARVEAIHISEGQEDEAAAVRSVSLEEYNAQAAFNRGKGRGDEAAEFGAGNAKSHRSQIDSLVEAGVDPNVAAHVLMAWIKLGYVADSDLGTYVEGGSGITPALPLGNEGGKKQPEPDSSQPEKESKK